MYIYQKNETDKLVKQQQKFLFDTSIKYLMTKNICYTAPGDDQNKQWKLASTDSMIWPTLYLFHAMFGHPSSQCTHSTL